MEEFAWLFKLIPEGASVSAVMALVIVFLKFGSKLLSDHSVDLKALQDTHQNVVGNLTVSFTEQLKETRECFSDQLKEVTTLFVERNDTMQAKVNTLTEAHIKVSTETISALNGLKDAVRDLQMKAKI